jgi:hypothetical protein
MKEMSWEYSSAREEDSEANRETDRGLTIGSDVLIDGEEAVKERAALAIADRLLALEAIFGIQMQGIDLQAVRGRQKNNELQLVLMTEPKTINWRCRERESCARG